MDMMEHAVNKMKWNVEYSDVQEGQHLIDNNGLIRTDEKSMQGGYVGYEARFYPHKIVHTSYSGTYTYEIKIQEEKTDSIIAEYLINGKIRVYVYNLSDLKDCEHYFDDEDKLVRTLVKIDKGMSEEDYYSEMAIPDVTKMVLAAERKLRQTT